ncbi:MAG: hypothetical protein HY040_28785 [Planctomycetes bacterium]|nr:hypothetical protein [Planctomycetota bacterium]
MLPPDPRITTVGACEFVAMAPNGVSFVTVHRVSCVAELQVTLWSGDGRTRRKLIRYANTGVPCVAYSPDSQRFAVLSGQKKWWDASEGTPQLQTFDAETGHELSNIDSHDWLDLSKLSAVFYSHDGRLRGFQRAHPFVVWDIEHRRKLAERPLPAWCWLRPKEPLPANSGPNSIGMATVIEGRWDLVLREIYPANPYWSGVGDPLAVSGDGKKVFRVFMPMPFYGGHALEEWDLVTDQSTIVPLPFIPRDGFHPPISSDGRLIALPLLWRISDDHIWRRVKDWLGLVDTDAVGGLGLLDTATGIQIARFPHAKTAFFTPGNDAVAVVYNDRTELWELPLHKPWHKIAFFAVATFAAILVLAQSVSLVRLLFSKRAQSIAGAQSAHELG